MQLKRIHGGQEAVLDTTEQQKEKKEDIRRVREDIQNQQTGLRSIQNKQREKDKRIKDRHKELIEIQERQRNMQEVIRLKKLEERREIDNQVSQGLLLIGSPDIKKNRIEVSFGENSVRNELSDIANHIGVKTGSHRRGGSILKGSHDDSSKMSPSRFNTKLKPKDLAKLEEKC